jgi:hypothetical protein
VCRCLCLCVRACVYMYVYMSLCKHASLYVCMYVCMYVVLPHFESTDKSSLTLLQILMFCQLWYDAGYCRYRSCSLNLTLDILALICARYQVSTRVGVDVKQKLNNMKINILLVGAEGTVPIKCIHSLFTHC